jgi:hypothetical protein
MSRAPRFAGDVDGCLAARELLDYRAHVFDSRARAKKLGFPRLGRRNLLGKRQCRLHQRSKLIQRQRFGQIVERTGFEGRHRVFGAAECRNHRYGQVHALGAYEAHKVKSVTVGQSHVSQTEIVTLGLEQLLGLRHRPGALYGQPHSHERKLQQLADIGLVVDDQHRALHGV